MKMATSTKDLLLTLVLIVIALAMTPSIVTMTVNGQYGNFVSNETFLKTGAGTTKACTLANDGSRFDDAASSTWILVRLGNATGNYTLPSGGTTWSVTTNSTATSAAIITVTGITASQNNWIYIDYWYLLDAASVAIIGLIPLLYVTLILGISAVVVYKELKNVG
jgi:hypothetical protein